MNKVILMGRLVADPEFSMTTSGIAKCTFRIAVDRDYTKPGEEKQSDFFRITCWRQTAEFVDKYFVKGKPILVEGKIQNDNYVDKNGIQQYREQIIADNVKFLLSDPTRNSSGNSGRRYDDYDNDRYDDRRSSRRNDHYDDDDYRRGSSRRNDHYDDDDYRRGSSRRNDRYDDDDDYRRGSRSSRYDDDYDDRRSSRRDDDDDRRRDAQDEERRSASSQPKKDVQLGNDNSDDSDLGDLKEIISENDLPF